MKDAIKLSYQDQETTFATLSKISGVCITTLHSRWRKMGRPSNVPDEMMGPSRAKGRDAVITLDGQPTTIKKLMTLFRMGKSTVAKKVKLRKGKMLTKHFVNKNRSPTVAKSKPSRVVFKEDRSPGWLERREFPNTGNNGFCKVDRSNDGHRQGLELIPFYTE